MYRAEQQLQHLRDISTLLTRVPSVEHTLAEVIDIVTRALPLRSAIFILETAGRTQTIAWPSASESARWVERAKAHARESYGYLVRSGVDFARDGRTLEIPRPRAAELETQAERDAPTGFVLLPLVVEHGPIFGAFQLEAARPFDEVDLVFVNAVVNQLAIAIDRHAVILARQATTEAAEKEQRLLAEVSSVLATSLESRKALSAVTRFVVPHLADLCFLDVVEEDGTVERLEVRFADEGQQRALAEQLRRPRAAQRPGGGVIASGEPLLLDLTQPLTVEGPDEEQAAVLRVAGIGSLMVVPLVARGNRLGALTLAAAESRGHYTPRDLALAVEIAHRTAMALDNALLYEQAQRATRSREDLLSVVSHDLKNPLGVILMNLANLAMRAPAGEDRRRSAKQHDAIERSANRMKRLVEDLLDAASIEAGRLTVEPARVGIGPVVVEAVEVMQAGAAHKSLALVSEVPPELPVVWADVSRVQQVLANLIGNAMKFTPFGGSITVAARPSADAVTISVRDTGPGIIERDLSHLFGRFWQVQRTARLGTGLGLFISKAIVDAHGGEIWVESKVGAGSTFSFTLRVPGPEPAAPAGS
jgi:signal transduction histidine kinase